MEKELIIENIPVGIYNNPKEMGKAAADFVERTLKEAIAQKGGANLILATGSSQFTFLESLKERDIDWKKITVFHLDEYKGISNQHPASFRKYLKERILDEVAPKKTYYLNGDAEDLEQEMLYYTNELKKHPIDLACIGIGENGHIAFNDPPVADFNDPKWVKLVTLDEACKKQQTGEGWFPTLDDVPDQALTLTITAILNCDTISCVVPDERKAEAVRNTLYHEISTDCPATILRTHPKTKIFLDNGSASKL
ncbi:glucosamine-6-phosphate deaminase [Pseudozobellia thermophila]|uniref:Glucosamine-6-phosphate deaminase n=1 Tax=Pseudozobellia thermophila TaxID=192903 RepID=A0A1M6NKZ5_9FLAO|nr:glucosamine-6-phosphate deaminase [Pseudozobellia thermophila]SHJ96336.1 glucosamine-6-phosphate deaminase [Pseudozobellia thermophila]